MKNVIDFKIFIPAGSVIHLKEISVYNHNYYSISNCGDWFYGDCNILKVVCHEDENCYTYSLGWFDGDKFIDVLNWVTEEDIFE